MRTFCSSSLSPASLSLLPSSSKFSAENTDIAAVNITLRESINAIIFLNLFMLLYRITIAAIDGTSLCLEIITLEAFASPARLDGIISSRLPK